MFNRLEQVYPNKGSKLLVSMRRGPIKLKFIKFDTIFITSTREAVTFGSQTITEIINLTISLPTNSTKHYRMRKCFRLFVNSIREERK